MNGFKCECDDTSFRNCVEEEMVNKFPCIPPWLGRLQLSLIQNYFCYHYVRKNNQRWPDIWPNANYFYTDKDDLTLLIII